jgi:hypothetical protein
MVPPELSRRLKFNLQKRQVRGVLTTASLDNEDTLRQLALT